MNLKIGHKSIALFLRLAYLLLLFPEFFSTPEEKQIFVLLNTALLVGVMIYGYLSMKSIDFAENAMVFFLRPHKRIMSWFLDLMLSTYFTIEYAFKEGEPVLVGVCILLVLDNIIESYLKQRNRHFNLIITRDLIIANDDSQNIIDISDIQKVSLYQKNTYLLDQGLKKDKEYIYVDRVRKDQQADLIRYMNKLSEKLERECSRKSNHISI